MKKTTNARIGKQLFTLDIDAFELIEKYLKALENHFSNLSDETEVVEDIEFRLAELLTEELGGRSIIEANDVNNVLKKLGSIEDLTGEPEKESNSLLFSKKLMRDPQRGTLGGVATGLGLYFGLDPVIFKVLFIVFTFFGGFGFITYFILWAVMPPIRTEAERKQIQGEPFTIKDFEQQVKHSAKNLEHEVESWSKKHKKKWKNNSRTQEIKSVGNRIGKLIAGLIGLGLITIGFLGIIGGFAAISGSTLFEWNDAESYYISGIVTSFTGQGTNYILFMSGIALLIILPFLGIAIFGLRMMNILPATWTKAFTLASGGLWFAGLIIVTVVSIRMTTDWREQGEYLHEQKINPEKFEFILAIPPTETRGNGVLPVNVAIEIFSGPNDTSATIIVNSSSRGRSIPEASVRAKETLKFIDIQHNTIEIAERSILPLGELYRGQSISLEFYVPEGYTFHVHRSLRKLFRKQKPLPAPLPGLYQTWIWQNGNLVNASEIEVFTEI
jgi:phage shock protein PspC (stress-responsive transcriptional regulator)